MEQITIRDIARKCGVGVSTVSRAMNNHPDINPETKAMILKVMSDYHYVPNNSARNLKRSDARAIAVLVKGMDNMFFGNMISILEEKARKKKYSCLIERVEEKADEVDTAIEIVKEKRLRGIIFLGGNFTHPREKMEQIPVPYVLTTAGIRREEGLTCASVSVDDYRESRRMAEYLISCGHRKIAILAACEDDISIGRLRLDAYCDVLKERRIPIRTELIRHMSQTDSYSFETGYKLTTQLLSEKAEFTALYTISDTLAIGACRALKDAGLRVPEDISVAGFDGIDVGEYYIPSITTIRQPVEAMATESARKLFAMIGEQEEPSADIFEGELVIRESTGMLSEELPDLEKS